MKDMLYTLLRFETRERGPETRDDFLPIALPTTLKLDAVLRQPNPSGNAAQRRAWLVEKHQPDKLYR
jgi:hypothetical protein